MSKTFSNCQAIRIAELAIEDPNVKMNPMKLAVIALAVAGYEVEEAQVRVGDGIYRG